jgi:hypothetical protein
MVELVDVGEKIQIIFFSEICISVETRTDTGVRGDQIQII